MKLLQNILALTLIAATQFGSLGILLSKHYCKGALTEVSVLLSNKGCSDDLSIFDRLNHTEHDCHKTADDNGVRKAPCCDFESTFSKIYLFQEDVYSTSVNIDDLSAFASTLEKQIFKYCTTLQLSVVPRPPPNIGVKSCIQYCRFLI